MNAYEKAKSLQLTGTDAEIVAVLQSLTVADIPCKAIARLLREESLLLWTGEKYRGAIQQAVESPGIPSQFIDGIDELKSAVFGGSAEYLQTTVPFWAGRVAAIMAAIAQVIPQTAGLVDRVYALDGGRPWRDLTVEQFAALRSAAESQSVKQVALDKVLAATEAAQAEYRKANSTPESIVAAAVAVLEAVE
jgi:hypothetical protein